MASTKNLYMYKKVNLDFVDVMRRKDKDLSITESP